LTSGQVAFPALILFELMLGDLPPFEKPDKMRV